MIANLPSKLPRIWPISMSTDLTARCRPVIVVAGGLGLPHNHGKHFAAKWSAASRSRSLPFHRSR